MTLLAKAIIAGAVVLVALALAPSSCNDPSAALAARDVSVVSPLNVMTVAAVAIALLRHHLDRTA